MVGRSAVVFLGPWIWSIQLWTHNPKSISGRNNRLTSPSTCLGVRDFLSRFAKSPHFPNMGALFYSLFHRGTSAWRGPGLGKGFDLEAQPRKKNDHEKNDRFMLSVYKTTSPLQWTGISWRMWYIGIYNITSIWKAHPRAAASWWD